MTILVGSEDRFTGGASTDTEFTVNSIQIIEHPDYNGILGSSNSNGADVCLVEVPNLTDAQPAGCVDCWKPACIPAQDAHVDDKRLCYVGGWGTTSSGGSSSTLVNSRSFITRQEHQLLFKSIFLAPRRWRPRVPTSRVYFNLFTFRSCSR